MPRVLVALVLAAVAGCGGDDPEPAVERTPAAAEQAPAEYPVAWAVHRADLAKLGDKPLPEAVEGAEVIGRTSWDSYPMVVLGEWLDEHGVALDRPRVPEAHEIGEAWDAPVLVLTAAHAQRYGRKLERLRPGRKELQAFADEFTEEQMPDAGEAMAQWLEITRRSLASVTGDRVVVIPISE